MKSEHVISILIMCLAASFIVAVRSCTEYNVAVQKRAEVESKERMEARSQIVVDPAKKP